jgi:hypothetical protein
MNIYPCTLCTKKCNNDIDCRNYQLFLDKLDEIEQDDYNNKLNEDGDKSPRRSKNDKNNRKKSR